MHGDDKGLVLPPYVAGIQVGSRYGNLGNPMTDPWDNWYIYLHEWLNNYGINVGKYTSPMDPMGYIFKKKLYLPQLHPGRNWPHLTYSI